MGSWAIQWPCPNHRIWYSNDCSGLQGKRNQNVLLLAVNLVKTIMAKSWLLINLLSIFSVFRIIPNNHLTSIQEITLEKTQTLLSEENNWLQSHDATFSCCQSLDILQFPIDKRDRKENIWYQWGHSPVKNCINDHCSNPSLMLLALSQKLKTYPAG